MKKVGKRSSKKKTSGFVYKERSAASVKKRAEQRGGRFDSPVNPDVDTYRAKEGDNCVRILPPTWADAEHYAYEVWVHAYVGADQSTYLCRKRMLNKPCALCDAAKEAKDAGEAEEAKQLEAVSQYWCWVIDRESREKDVKPLLWQLSWTRDRDLAALCYSSRTGKTLLIDHPDEGYDVSFRREGMGQRTKYTGLQIDRDQSPIDDDEEVQEEILKWIEENPVPGVLRYYENDYLEKVISGTAEETDEDLDEEDDDEEEEKTSKRSKSSKKSARDEEEDDEEEDDEEEEEEEDDEDEEDKSESDDDEEEDDEEEEEEEDDDEDDEEDDEEEKPSRRTSSKTSKSKSKDEDEEEDDDEEEEEDGEEADEDDDEDEDDEDDEDDDEDEAPKERARRTNRVRTTGKAKGKTKR